MNKKGFTLIEILMVLVILVTITVAGTFGIQSIQKKSEEKSLEELYSEILLAADVYLNENETFTTDLLNKEVDEKCIRIYTLQNEGLLSTSLTNHVTKKLIPGNLCVISYLSEDGTIKNSFDEEVDTKKVTLNVINGSSDIAYKNVHHKATFTVTLNEGITTEDTTMSCDNGATIAMNNNVVTVTNVVKDTTCTVNFKVPTYNVKLNVTNGSVANANLTVEKNKNAEFTITPNEGYSLTLESDSCNGVMEGNVYKVNNITSDKTCNISLKKSNYTITMTVINGNGNLTTQSVNYNENATFTVTPNTGYLLQLESDTCSGVLSGNSYTIKNVKGNIECSIEFAENPKLLTTVIKSNAVNENGYRYEGKNPNNYIYMENNGTKELWRIIGLFPDGTSGEDVIRVRKVGYKSAAYDTNSRNHWPISTLYTSIKDIYSLSNYKNTVNYKIYLGTTSEYKTITVSGWYAAERSTIAGATAKSSYSSVTTFLGSVGLMYPSDYGYAVLSSDCSRDRLLYDYDGQLYDDNSAKCHNNNWLYQGSGNWQWLMSPVESYSSYQITIGSRGHVTYYTDPNVKSSGPYSPVMALKSNVMVTGSGTASKPFKMKN